MNPARFEVFCGADSSWRWRLRAENGEIVAQGEGHSRRVDAVRAARRVAEIAHEADIVTVSEPAAIS